MNEQEKRAGIGELADAIEAEMRRLGIWDQSPPSEATVLEGGAFGHKTVPFEHWIQVVLVARLRAVTAGEMAIPGSSSVATQAMREWDGFSERDDLRSLLSELDGLISR